jgi:hypothetical protein
MLENTSRITPETRLGFAEKSRRQTYRVLASRKDKECGTVKIFFRLFYIGA